LVQKFFTDYEKKSKITSLRWFLGEQLHREDGPAIEFSNGTKHWYRLGRLHRVDGPAMETADGGCSWWFNGKHIPVFSQVEFELWLVTRTLVQTHCPANFTSQDEMERWLDQWEKQ